MQRIPDDIAALGVVGEADNTSLIYLVGTSRIQNKPLRAIVRGTSSGGKNEITDQTARLFPEDAVKSVTVLSPQVLYYADDDELVHKWLKQGERSQVTDPAAAADQTAALRQLISENKIDKWVTQKVGGEFTKVHIVKYGPIAFTQSTTLKQNRIFAEDLNRCLLITPDETPEQTKSVLLQKGAYYAAAVKPDVQAIIDRHVEFQDSLENVPVVIPFATALLDAVPYHRVEARRAAEQIMATVMTIALLHQFQRGRDKHGNLLATVDDYAIARRLLLAPLGASIGVMDTKLQQVKDRLLNEFPDRFTATQAQRLLRDRAESTVRQDLSQLVGTRVLEKIGGGRRGSPTAYRWTSVETDELVLPLPESLVSAIPLDSAISRSSGINPRKNG
jgi:hypothetical protein